MVTVSASAAATVNVEEAPGAIDAGLAVIVTVGAPVVSPGPTLPHPARSRSREKLTNIAIEDSSECNGLEARTLFMVILPMFG
jgi:hypothetical protein